MARTDRLTRPALCAVAATVAALHLGLLGYLAQPAELRLAGTAPQSRHLGQAGGRHWQARLTQSTVEVPDNSQGPLPTETVTPTGAAEALLTTSVATADESWSTDDEPFLPRSVLSKAPKVLTVIDIPFPEGLVGQGNYRSTLALYIDETGVVRRVEVTGQALPPPLEEAARLTFMKASFTPGELGGQPVKARIVVEVSFDDSEPALGQQAASTSLPAPV